MSNQTDEGAAVKVKRSVNSILFGNWNAEYTRENQRRMLYLQQKYIEAYQSSRPAGTESVLEATNRLKLTADGKRPANPFHDVHAWDNALNMPSDLTAGHQGRWTASHARLCLGRINEYQIQRRDRTYVPGVQCHGRANDYRNMFLQEIKEWIQSYFTLENVRADELRRRSNYLAKVKMDNFHWCFPNEGSYYGEHNFHDVVDYVHEKINDALNIVEREEKNRSMSDLLKELNDHVTNVSEYGKGFLANILYSGPKNKAGSDLLSSTKHLDRTSYTTGLLLSLLENAQKSNSLALAYNRSPKFLKANDETASSSSGGKGLNMIGNSSQMLLLGNGENSALPSSTGGSSSNYQKRSSIGKSNKLNNENKVNSDEISNLSGTSANTLYQARITTPYSNWSLTGNINFIIDFQGPVNHGIISQWQVKRTKQDFNELQRMLDEVIPQAIKVRLPWNLSAEEFEEDNLSSNDKNVNVGNKLGFLGSFKSKVSSSNSSGKFESKEEDINEEKGGDSETGDDSNHLKQSGNVNKKAAAPPPSKKQMKELELEQLCSKLELFLHEISNHLSLFPPHALQLVAKFYDIDQIDDIPEDAIVPAEDAPQIFSLLRELLLASPPPTLISHKSEKKKFRKQNGNTLHQLPTKKEAEKSARERGIPLEVAVLEMTWGRTHAALLLEAHALLQRTSILLGWTREVNQIFASMFGNALAFSKLPLRELLETMRDLLTRSLAAYKEIHKHACDLNAAGDYKWHRNLRASEQVLLLVVHHTEGAISCIETLQREHLDEEIQRKRLAEVAEKFVGFMARVDRHLPMLQSELPAMKALSAQEREAELPRNIMDTQHSFDINDDALDDDDDDDNDDANKPNFTTKVQREEEESRTKVNQRELSSSTKRTAKREFKLDGDGEGSISQRIVNPAAAREEEGREGREGGGGASFLLCAGDSDTILPSSQQNQSDSKVCVIS